MSKVTFRSVLLAFLLLAEMIVSSVWLDTGNIHGPGFLSQAVEQWGPRAIRIVLTFAIFYLIFGNANLRAASQRISHHIRKTPVSWILLGLHLCLAGLFYRLSSVVFGGPAAPDGWVAAWFLAGAAAVAAVSLALIPARAWLEIVRCTRNTWAFGLATAVVATMFGIVASTFWRPASALTFRTVGLLLRPLVPDLVTDPSRLMMATSKFAVVIAPACSGLEGVGMVLAFTGTWLWFFRREHRFPQSLLLLPAGACAAWILNAVRLTGLFLIGHKGAVGVATGGFHSQAGWIGFLVVALVIAWISRRIRWFSQSAPVELDTGSGANPVASFLVPFLAILGAALVARSASADFEWLYPLRFFAAAAALWYFRREYRNLNWRVGWEAPIVGVVVFALWMALEPASVNAAGPSLGIGLASLSAAGRPAWLFFRTAAAVATVPIAEELAFRGFLMRRLISADFEAVSCRAFALAPFLLSSLAFGILHGDRWLAGAIAGMLYAALFLRRGSIGDAATAHATTNALLSIWVLSTGAWHLW